MSRRLKIGCWFNSPYLGGAERSFIHQVNYIKDFAKVTSFIPLLDGDARDLVKELESHSLIHKKVDYPKGLFSFSRSEKSSLSHYLKVPFYLLKLFRIIKIVNLKSYDSHWVNGNKIGLVLFFLCKITRFKGNLVWHFRDYPAGQGLYKYIWKLLGLKHSFNLVVVGNSESVTARAREVIYDKWAKFFCLYNFVGENLQDHEFSLDGVTLGAASMYAPWKGLHEIVMMAALYEKELKDLGVKKISLFGEMIYQTNGSHHHYFKELILLKNKTGANLVKFEGKKKPAQIYREIDILIHSSISPEPFGRVLAEALKSKIPVVSTGLGGAGEIISHLETGMVYQKNDYADLFVCLKQVIENEIFRNKLIDNGLDKYSELFHDACTQLNDILRAQGVEIEEPELETEAA